MKYRFRIKKIKHNNPIHDYYVIERSFFGIFWDKCDRFGDVNSLGGPRYYNNLDEAIEDLNSIRNSIEIGSEIIK